MRISFFEEFPTKDNLDKIKLIDFPTKLYIAAKSINDFNSIKIKSKFVKEKIYWPLLEKKEGYWFSPFAKRKAMIRILNEVKNTNTPIMLDAELPTTQNSLLYFTQLHNFLPNRKMLRKFVRSHKEVYTAEYFPSSRKSEKILTFLGLSFKSKNHYPIKMIYSSMHNFGETIMRSVIKSGKEQYGDKYLIGLGVLTHGILGFEPPISLRLLERDLKICKEMNVKEVIIFRLGGLNKKYIKLLKKYSK